MSEKVTRRKLLLAGGAAAITPLLAAKVAGPQEQASQKRRTAIHKGDYKVSYYNSSDDRHAELLHKHFAGLKNDPVFQKLAPLSMVVIHRSGPPVVAYTAKWSMTTPAGTYSNVLFHYGKPTSHPTQRGKTPSVSGKRHLIRAGEAILVTPFFSWNSSQYERLVTKGFSWKKFVKPREPGAFFVNQMSSGSSVDVKLDAVIFADHKLAGDNKHKLAVQYAARRHGEHDVAAQVHRMIRKGSTQQDVIEALTQTANGARPTGSRKQVWYGLAKRFYALKMLSIANNKGEEKLSRVARHVARQPRTKVKEIA